MASLIFSVLVTATNLMCLQEFEIEWAAGFRYVDIRNEEMTRITLMDRQVFYLCNYHLWNDAFYDWWELCNTKMLSRQN